MDSLILLGVVRDLLVNKRIHPVYLWGLPLMMLGQIATMYVMVTKWPPRMKAVNAIFG